MHTAATSTAATTTSTTTRHASSSSGGTKHVCGFGGAWSAVWEHRPNQCLRRLQLLALLLFRWPMCDKLWQLIACYPQQLLHLRCICCVALQTRLFKA